jgi:hypothetical protein
VVWSVEVGRANSHTLVVLETPGGPKACPVSASGTPGTAFELEAGVDVDQFSAAVTADGSASFAIAWSDRRVADGRHRTLLALASAAGMTGAAVTVHAAQGTHRMVQIVPIQGGFALLEEVGGMPLVVFVDEEGAVTGPALRLLGTQGAWGIATRGDQLVVLAWRDDDREALRAFDFTGTPTGDWVCLNAPSTNYEHGASIDVEGDGYLVLYREADEAEKLVHVTDANQGS